MTKRVWHHLMGRGIVGTVDNFGDLGDRPSHPQRLDHLAVTFMEEGWSVKRLARRIMLTRSSFGQQAGLVRVYGNGVGCTNALFTESWLGPRFFQGILE